MADDDRPQYQHGVGTIGGTQFHWGSGTPGKYWSIPYGDYPVTPNAPTGAWAHQAGAIPIANNVIPDPLLGRNRIGIMIHSGSAPDLDQLYTQGCFKVDPQDWPNVRSQILAQADKGPLYLHVAPGGVAAFTNTKTFSQAGEDTPAATANATANTTAATQPSGGGAAPTPYTFKLPANAPMGMGNNNPLNIKYYQGAEAHYPGLVGPSTNTDQGDPQMKFSSPEAGWSAAYSLLNQKYGSGMTTPNQIIAGKGGWTPGNTQAAANVAKSAGIGPDDDIGFSDPAKAQKFMRALVTQEQGGAGSAYPDEMIAAAVGGKAPPTTAAPAPVGTTLTSVGGGDASKLPGFGTAAASKSFTEGLEKLAPGIAGGTGAGGQGGQDQQPQPSPILPPPEARNVAPPLAPAMEAQLTGYMPKPYGQTLNSFATPLEWGSAPPGASPYAPGLAAGANPLSVQPPATQQGAGTQMAATSPIGTSLSSLDPEAYQQRLAMLYGTTGGQGGYGGGY